MKWKRKKLQTVPLVEVPLEDVNDLVDKGYLRVFSASASKPLPDETVYVTPDVAEALVQMKKENEPEA